MSAVAGVVMAMLAGSPQVSQQGDCAETRVEVSVARLLEAGGVDGSGWAVKVDVVREDGPRYVANLEIEDPEGGLAKRSVSSPTCAVAIDAVAFIVVTALAENAAEPVPATEPEPEPVVPEPVVSEPEPIPRDDPAPVVSPAPAKPQVRRTRPPLSGRVFAGAGIMGGALPGVVAQLRLGGAVEGVLWRAELGVAATSRRDARAATNRSVGADLGHWAVDARGCGRIRAGARVSVPLCAGAEVGQLYASGFGFSGARTITLPWGAALASAGVGIDFTPRLRLAAQGTAGLVLNRAEIVVDNLGSLHTLSTALGRGWLGLELRI